MRLHTDSISQREHAASFAVATCVTLGATLLLLGAVAPRFIGQAIPGAGVRHVLERIDYVTPPAPTLAKRRVTETPRMPTRPRPQLIGGSATRQTMIAPPPDSARSASPTSAPTPTLAPTANPDPAEGATHTRRMSAGAPIAGASAGFTRISKPIRFDSALRAMTDSVGIGLTLGAIKPPPPTQAEIDAKWRDEAFEAAAAHGTGRPVLHKMVGGSIPVPLPFGGPSRKQRERDRAVEAQLKVLRAQRQARIDSILATRRRRADSLARGANRTRVDSL